MEKQTLKFASLAEMAKFSKVVATGFLMNTNKFTLTGKFTDKDINRATREFGAVVIETTDKIFTY